MNINFSCRPSVLPFLVLFTHALSFPLSTVISALTLCPVFDAMRYYGNVMTTRWWLCVTMATLWQQDGGYALLWKRYDNNKMVAMRYYGNVMTTRWWLCVTMETLWQQQVGGYALLWKRYDILHLQQYSHRLNLLFLSYSYSHYGALHCALLLVITTPAQKFFFFFLL